jgi:hypothetical protein
MLRRTPTACKSIGDRTASSIKCLLSYIREIQRNPAGNRVSRSPALRAERIAAGLEETGELRHEASRAARLLVSGPLANNLNRAPL